MTADPPPPHRGARHGRRGRPRRRGGLRLDGHRGRQRLPDQPGRLAGADRQHRRSPTRPRASRCRAHPGLRRREGSARDEPHHRRRTSGWPPRSDGERILVCNNAAVASNGDVWFSDSSAGLSAARSGRATSPSTPAAAGCSAVRADGRVEVHLTGLAFANGVALAGDESFVCVAESGDRSVVRLWLVGAAGRDPRPPGRGPPGLSRQHRARQRRTDLGDHRLAEGRDAGG